MKTYLAAVALTLATLSSGASATITTFAQGNQTFAGYAVSYDSTTKTLSNYGTNLFTFDIYQDGHSSLESTFSLSATSAATAVSAGGQKIMDGFTGSFSFTYNGPDTTLNGITYHAGDNLLTGIFSNAAIVGNGSAGSFAATNQDGTVEFSSAALDFLPTASRDFSFALNAAFPSFAVIGGNLQSFSASATGTFASDRSDAALDAILTAFSLKSLNFGDALTVLFAA